MLLSEPTFSKCWIRILTIYTMILIRNLVKYFLRLTYKVRALLCNQGEKQLFQSIIDIFLVLKWSGIWLGNSCICHNKGQIWSDLDLHGTPVVSRLASSATNRVDPDSIFYLFQTRKLSPVEKIYRKGFIKTALRHWTVFVVTRWTEGRIKFYIYPTSFHIFIFDRIRITV